MLLNQLLTGLIELNPGMFTDVKFEVSPGVNREVVSVINDASAGILLLGSEPQKSKLLTIDTILRNLDMSDMRRTWWKQVRELIRDRMYSAVLARLISHKDDIDFDQQVQVISNAIVRHLESRSNIL